MKKLLKPWTLIFAVLTLIAVAELTALGVQHAHQVAGNMAADTAAYAHRSDSGTQPDINPVVLQTGPAQSSSGASSQSNPKTSTKATTSSQPDQYDCIPGPAEYDACVAAAKQNALTLWCGQQSKKASDIYYPQTLQAQAAYDAVMAEWDAVKDLPYYQRNPYDEYAADAKTKYNAIEKPAYAAYVSAINELNNQGCHEPIVYTDTSWSVY